MDAGTDHKDMTEAESGQWVLVSLGAFIQILVDEGNDPAVAFRVVEDRGQGDGQFSRHFELWALPQGSVMKEAERIGCTLYSTLMERFVEAGLIK